ncbi:MAG: hypothetical protein AAF830_10215 [Pseudomonadota bacterium]
MAEAFAVASLPWFRRRARRRKREGRGVAPAWAGFERLAAGSVGSGTRGGSRLGGAGSEDQPDCDAQQARRQDRARPPITMRFAPVDAATK